MTVERATSLRFLRKHTLPQSSVPSLFGLKVEILNYQSERSGRAARRQKFEDNYENRKDVVKQVNMPSPVQVAGKYGFEIGDPRVNKHNYQCLFSFL